MKRYLRYLDSKGSVVSLNKLFAINNTWYNIDTGKPIVAKLLITMKHTLIILALVGAVGCKNEQPQTEEISTPSSQNKIRVTYGSWGRVYEFDIDGCQYLNSKSGDAVSIIHKGNCNNPIHSPQNTKR